MSIFIASLAFGESPELELAKLAILIGSFISALFGVVLLRTTPSDRTADA
jgi:Na+/H+ antiporter NhaA